MNAGNKRALVVVAHGSRRKASNDELVALAANLAVQDSNPFDLVQAAFLELAEPSIPDGIEQCIQQGASEVVVFPYFLSAGRHVVEDVPAEVKIKQDEYPDLKIELVDYLGASPALPELILRQIDV
jgi:sirohydrochlorin ferrochelatase